MKRIIIVVLLLMLLLSGCTVQEPGVMQIKGTDGLAHNINIASDGQFVVNTETVFQEIAMHNELERKAAYSFHVMGRRAGFSSTTVLNDLKEFDATTSALFPVLTGVEALEIVSTTSNDSAAGDGARTVRVLYINTSNNLVYSPNISMNGTSPVPAGFTANFIISMEVTSLGVHEVSVGNIVLRTTVGAVIQEQITAGGNRSLSSHFMVPANYTGYLVSWEGTSITTAGGSTQTQDIRLRATVNEDGTLSTAYHFLDNQFLASGTASPQVELPYIKLPQLAKVKVSTISSSTATTTRLDSSYCVFIVHN